MQGDGSLMRIKPAQVTPPARALAVEISDLGKRFGRFVALDRVSLKIDAGAFHALLGENGAGKSTLVKCLVGFHRPDTGQIQIDRRECEIRTPQDASALGIGMVYQHFTLVPSMTVAENLVMSRSDVPAVIRWKDEHERIAAFLKTVPFKVPLDRPVSRLAAGERQKVEILKQLYLQRRFMILDEPTSVLTPVEADEVLGMLRDLTREGSLTVLMITHKFREVIGYADTVSILRRGRHVGGGAVDSLSPSRMAELMVGERAAVPVRGDKVQIPAVSGGAPRLSIENLRVNDDSGHCVVPGLSLAVHTGEIVGVAGVSGNGQRELVEALIGQRERTAGTVRVNGQHYQSRRSEIRAQRTCSLPEEPLRNACCPGMSVAENMALRNFDQPPLAAGPWLRRDAMIEQAERWIRDFNVQTQDANAPIATLSGGNVQRAVLARELSHPTSVLICANPVFGLDFAAVADIHDRILAARNAGAAVLLISEDLDELLELSDRLVVMFDGRIVHETTRADADIDRIGPCMAGHFIEHA